MAIDQTYGNQGQFSAADISNFIQQNINDPAAIANAASQYGISAQDIQSASGYTPEQQTSYFSNAFGGPHSEETGLEYLNKLYTQGVAPAPGGPVTTESTRPIVQPTYGNENQFSAQDIQNYIAANLSDPTKIYQAAQQYGITPEQLKTIYTGSEYDTGNLEGLISDYLGQGKAGYEQSFGDILNRTFGTEDNRSSFESLLGGRQISDIFQPDKYSKMSLENIEAELGASDLNKYQSAIDTARYANYMFGADQDAQQKIVADIMAGKIDNPLVEKAYKDLLAGNTLTSDTQMDLLREAAKANPNAPIFQAKPELYAAYSPLGETKEQTAAAGQYGYYNNAPILSASEIDKVLDGGTLAQDFRSGRTDENSMGWDLYSRDAGRIANGVSVFGITDDKAQIKRLDELNKSLADLGQVQKVTGGDSGDYYVAQKVKTDSEGNPYLATETIDSYQYDQYLDQKAKIDSAAEKLGIDASEYDSLTDLYNAIQDKSKDLYQITGRTVGWDPAVAEKLGIKTLTADAGDMNHASVLYKREGDKLLAISDPTIFTANDKRRSGFAAQVAPWAPLIAMATLPFGGVGGAVSQGLGALAGTAMPAYMPAMISAAYGTAMSGGDFNDFTRTLLTQGATDFMANQFTQGLQSLVKDGTISADFAKDIAKVGAGAIATGAREGDVTGYLKNAGINYAFNEALSNLGSKAGFDTKNMTASEKIILSSLMPAVLRGQMSEKDLINMLTKAASAKSKE